MSEFNNECPNFACLSQLESYRREDGRFEFRMSWPKTDLKSQHWYQTTNPYNVRYEVEGYEDIDCAYSSNSWCGLASGSNFALLNGSKDPDHWCYAFGSYQDFNGGLPGPFGTVLSVEIHVKPEFEDWVMIGRQTVGERWWPRHTYDWDGGSDEIIKIENNVTHPTFTFSVGENDPEASYVKPLNSFCFANKVLNFRSGWLHDAIYVNGERFGGRGGWLDSAIEINEHDRINKITIGPSCLSFGPQFGRGIICGFRDLEFINMHTKKTRQSEVSSNIFVKEARWEYNREALGLELFITGVNLQVPKNGKIPSGVPYYYIFTLAYNPSLKFSHDEFVKFWQWLSTIRYLEETHNEIKQNRTDFKHYVPATKEQRNEFNMKYRNLEERDRLIAAFSGSTSLEIRPSSEEAKIDMGEIKPFWGTSRSSVAEYQMFSITIHTVHEYDEYKNDFCIVMVAGGEQMNVQEVSYKDLCFDCDISVKAKVIGTCICVGLRDIEMLHETKFVRRAVKYYEPNRAASVVSFFALYGLRVLFKDLVSDRETWDIYLIAAKRGHTRARILAVLCFAIQILGPILLFIHSARHLDWDAEVEVGFTFLRVILLAYAAAYELQNIAIGNIEMKLYYFVAALPNYDNKILIAGSVINKVSRFFVACCTIIVIYEAEIATDIILNALALFFVLNVDNDLVTDGMLDDLFEEQMQKMYAMKTTTVIQVAENVHSHINIIPMYKPTFPTYLSIGVGYINMGLLSLGAIFFIIMGVQNYGHGF